MAANSFERRTDLCDRHLDQLFFIFSVVIAHLKRRRQINDLVILNTLGDGFHAHIPVDKRHGALSQSLHLQRQARQIQL